jgi:hypothetical protein
MADTSAYSRPKNALWNQIDPLFYAKGTCSWFGGPEGDGVDEDEGLAFFQSVSDAPHLFRHEHRPIRAASRAISMTFSTSPVGGTSSEPRMRCSATRRALRSSAKKERSSLLSPPIGDRTKTRIALPDLSPSPLTALGPPPFLLPLAGAGLPVLAGVGLLGWSRRRQKMA